MNLLYLIKPGLHVSKQTVIQGNIVTDANSYIAGTIHGDITTQATLIIEKTGVVNGNARAKNVIVKGKIKGNIHSDGKVDAKKKGEIDGQVYAAEVNVDKYSLLKGSIKKLHVADNDAYNEDAMASNDAASFITDETVRDEEKPQSWF
ncbi:MAG TPA: polymer-forming cytoskeletal protein [Parafilimonas sp.]|nr:polymer-forming cytoskeletal protein [Parafilimonas sp.]